MTIIAHKIQLLPNNKQISYFKKSCGVARFAWNWGLKEWDRQYQARKLDSTLPYPSGFGLDKLFTSLIDKEWQWIRETGSSCYKRPIAELDNAFKRFFKALAKRPVLKKKGKSRDSFYLTNTAIKVTDRHVKLPKLGNVRMRNSLRFTGKIMSARVSRDGDKWFIAISVELPDKEIAHPSLSFAVGIDVGVKALATLSTGESLSNPRALSRYQRRLKRLQRSQSRQVEACKLRMGLDKKASFKKGAKIQRSNRMARVQKQIQKVHLAIKGIRANTQHQLTANLTKRFGIICLEDLNVKGMTKRATKKKVKQKSGLNRNILDAGFGELRRQLTYKAERTGAQVVFIDRFAPSSKTCSKCGAIKDDLKLSDRDWTCAACGTHHDRDLNAARNIKKLGLAELNNPTEKKVKKTVGKLTVKRKQKATDGASESNGRGDNGSVPVVVLTDTTSIVEPSTEQGQRPQKTLSGSQPATHETARAGDFFKGNRQLLLFDQALNG